MTDTPKVPEGLRPANENPWYILMTLYGEQEGEEFDWELHEKNRKLWNAWAGQALNPKQQEAAAKSAGIKVAELASWQEKKKEVEDLFLKRCAAHGMQQAERTRLEHLATFSKIRIAKIHIIKRFSVMGFVFPLEVDARGAYFSRISLFRKSVFLKRVDFYNSIFFQKSSFRGVLFCRIASFRAVRFRGGATFVSTGFGGFAIFNESIFEKKSNFTSVKFENKSIFVKVEFGANLDFSSTSFAKEANFSHSNFSGSVVFNKSFFLDVVIFKFSTFQNLTSFDRVDFSGGGAGVVNFGQCHFSKPTSFRQALFRNGYPDFSGAILHDQTNFTARVEPTSDEVFKEKNLKGQTYWPKTTNQDPVSARDSCATIRHVLTKQGLPEEAHFFFRREMHFAGLPSEGRSFAERLPYILFGWFSDYGYSIQRPLLWLLCLWAFGAAAFWGYLAGCRTPAPLEAVEHPMGTAMGLSFSNLFPLFGFGRAFLEAVLEDLPPALKTLSGTQTVLSLPLLFFLGLGLRQRFRLR